MLKSANPSAGVRMGINSEHPGNVETEDVWNRRIS